MSLRVERELVGDGLRALMRSLRTGLAAAEARGDDVVVLGYSRELRSVADLLAKLEGLHEPSKVDVTVNLSLAEELAAYRRRAMQAFDAEIVEVGGLEALER